MDVRRLINGAFGSVFFFFFVGGIDRKLRGKGYGKKMAHVL